MTAERVVEKRILPWAVWLLLAASLTLMATFGPSAAGAAPVPAGVVVVYCAQDQVFAEPILAEFTRQTGIRVKPVFDSEAVKTVGLANRLLAERAHPVCDVFWGNEELRTRLLASMGVFRATNGWSAFGQRTRRIVVNPRWLTNHHSVNQSPRRSGDGSDAAGAEVSSPIFSLADLTNSRYRGRISLAFPLFGSTATHLCVLRARWGERAWLEWCRALAANRPFLEEGNSHVIRRVARGEAWIGLTDSDDVDAGLRQGLRVISQPLTPELLRIPNTVGIVRDGPNPANAGRMYDYLRSDPVRRRLEEAGALEADSGGGTEPDWSEVLAALDTATGQLKEIFRR